MLKRFGDTLNDKQPEVAPDLLQTGPDIGRRHHLSVAMLSDAHLRSSVTRGRHVVLGRDILGLRPLCANDLRDNLRVGTPEQEVHGGQHDLLDDRRFARAALAHQQHLKGPSAFPSHFIRLVVPRSVTSVRELRQEQGLVPLQTARHSLSSGRVDGPLFEPLREVRHVIARAAPGVAGREIGMWLGAAPRSLFVGWFLRVRKTTAVPACGERRAILVRLLRNVL